MNILNNTFIVGEETLKARSKETDYNDKQEIIKKIEPINKMLYENLTMDWWKPSTTGNKRIMICGTYPVGTSNGYSKVVYYISKFLGKYEDIDLTIYGFQNFSNTLGASIRSDIPSRVKLHDAYATEEPKRNGFGEIEITKYLKENPQDIIIIFNDNIVTSAITNNIMKDLGHQKDKFKLVSYMDQVYAYQKKEYIELLNKYYDSIIAFTPYWKEVARKLGIKESIPIHVLPHGFEHDLYYPIPTNIARMYFNLPQEDFMVLNLNRNQPRKRWDLVIIAWAKFVERHYQINVKNKKGDYRVNKHTKRNIKLLVGTQMEAYWNIMDIFENEIKFLEVPWDYAKNTIHAVEMPQQLSDRDINILYSCCDIGVSCAEGEGWGLCSSECLGVGKPQVLSYVGGIKEYVNQHNSIPILPVTKLYGDSKSNGIPVMAEIVNPDDVTEGFWKYFSNPELVIKHGNNGRQKILTQYKWETIVESFYKNVVPKL